MSNDKLTIAALRAFIEAKEYQLTRYGFRILPADQQVIRGEVAEAKRLLNLFTDERAHVEVSDE